MEFHLGCLASGYGSNVEAILNTEGLEASVKVIISNNPGARVLNLGKERNIPIYCLNQNNT
ncbi:hypothetical protein KAI32_01680 [Candidatus Pacearchaeota archaeon]|nr:hypothetical protein [Candidatus Pacearchaeota archaeon]